jgi:dynein heavy chain
LNAANFCAQTVSQLLGLFYHESCRVYQDRLVNDEDRQWFEKLLATKMMEDYGVNIEEVVTMMPFLFADFADDSGSDEKIYAFVPDHNKVGLEVFRSCLFL